jgi:hypothetical protein
MIPSSRAIEQAGRLLYAGTIDLDVTAYFGDKYAPARTQNR